MTKKHNQNWNAILTNNLKWNGQTGDENISGKFLFDAEQEKNDFLNFDLADHWNWEFDEDNAMLLSFSACADDVTITI